MLRVATLGEPAGGRGVLPQRRVSDRVAAATPRHAAAAAGGA